MLTGYCKTCGVGMTDTLSQPTTDCGGDCLKCMAESDDLDCIRTMLEWHKSEIERIEAIIHYLNGERNA